MECSGRPRNVDQIGRKVGKCRLGKVLKIVRENRWIADWLYPSEGTPPHPQLTPEAFQNALAVGMSHSMTQSHFEIENVFSGKTEKGPPKVIMSKELSMLVVPIATADSCTVGYTFCSGKEYTQITGFTPVTTAQGRHYIMSRFVYDTRERQFLNISPNMTTNMAGIFQMIFHCDGSCERNFLAVPRLHYTADHLPTVVISSQCNLETRDLSTGAPSFQFADPEQTAAKAPAPGSSADMGGALDDFFRDMNALTPEDNAPLPFGAADPLLDPFLLETGAPLGPTAPDANLPDFGAQLVPTMSSQTAAPTKWPIGHDGMTDDGVGVPRKPGNASTSSGMFDMSAMTGALAKLERSMKGNFFALRAKRDVMDPLSGELLSRQTGHQISRVEMLPLADAAKLRDMSAQFYYSSNASPTLDAPLISPTIQSAAQRVLLPPRPVSISSTLGQSFSPPLEPALVPSMDNSGYMDIDPLLSDFSSHGPSPTTSSNGELLPAHSAKPVPVLAPRAVLRADTQPIKPALPPPAVPAAPVDKAEAKKIRNRLSAAKSNQKRRAQIEAQKKELVVLHLRVEELKKKKQQMTSENELLRAQYFGTALEELS